MPDEPTDREDQADLEPDPLDDLELVRTRSRDDDTPRGVSGHGLLPLGLAGLAVLAGGLLVTMLLLLRTPAKPHLTTAPTPPPAPLAAAATVPPTPPTPLPGLDDSDALARSLGATLSSNPDLARWLGQGALVRTVAAVVTNVAEGESPRPHLGFLAPARRFTVRTARGRLVPDPAGFEGYDAAADAVASVNTAAAASAYRAIEPLLDAAHRELGHPEAFRDSLDRAIAALLAVPVLPDAPPLVRHATHFRYADPTLEALTAAQKQFLRMGPRNVRLVQAKLREVQGALSPAPATP